MPNFYDMVQILEGKQDNALRAEAVSIANAIIDFIKNNPKNLYGDGLEYDPYKKALKIGDVIKDHPKLWLKFINQPGFGKNKSSLGLYDSNTISISLPQRTYTIATSPGYKNGQMNYFRKTISDKVANYLSNKGYETLIHEITHYLDSKRTKGKVFKNYPYNSSGEDYYNHPSEYNANLQSFLAKHEDKSFQEIMTLLPSEGWYKILNDKLKRHVLKRIAIIKHNN